MVLCALRKIKTNVSTCYFYSLLQKSSKFPTLNRGRRGSDRMVVGFLTTYAISAHHH